MSPVGIFGEKFRQPEQCVVVVEQEAERIQEYPFHSVAPTVSPYCFERCNDLRRDQRALFLGYIFKNIKAKLQFGRIEIYALDGVGDCLCQISMGVEDGKPAFISQNQVL